MIHDKLANANLYYNLKGLKEGFRFLLNTDLVNLADGRYEIGQNGVYANVSSLITRPRTQRAWEVHRKYIDIQYVIKGFECMGFGFLKDFNDTIEEYDEQKDIAFLREGKYNFINVMQGEFTVFFPTDVHAPMLAVGEPMNIKKVIVKIPV